MQSLLHYGMAIHLMFPILEYLCSWAPQIQIRWSMFQREIHWIWWLQRHESIQNYNSQTGKVVYSRSVKFDEDWLFDEGKSSSGTLHRMVEHLYKNYNLMLLKEIQQLRMLKESKQVQDHMGRDSYLGSKQHMLGQTHHLAHDRYLLQ